MADNRRIFPTIDPGLNYLAATLLGDDAGWGLSFMSHFVGWPEGRSPGEGVELREPSLVHPQRMVDLWEKLGQGWMAVSKAEHLGLFVRLGGNALISEAIAHEYLADRIGPRECVRPGAIGFIDFDPDSRAATCPRPTPKQRFRVMERDGWRCQLCGERPSLNEHVVLQVHHIRPFGNGGLTDDENLITLCHTCHQGLDPHENLGLFHLPGGQFDRTLERYKERSFKQGVEEYRRRVASVRDG